MCVYFPLTSLLSFLVQEHENRLCNLAYAMDY